MSGAALMMAALAGSLSVSALAGSPPRLEVPVDCEIGELCFIQQYADHDPGSGVADYRCGHLSYDGHDGLDIRVPTMAVQQRGVAVVAAAPGTVRAVRDGMADVSVTVLDPARIKGRECGNGVVVVHGDGWETQYCHMANGSVRVTPGERVAAGTPLGLVGMSGEAEFPHVHFSVRHVGRTVDPFAYDAPAGSCGAGQSLWSTVASNALVYRSPQLLNWGFAATPVSMEGVEAGDEYATHLDRSSPAIVAFVRAIGLAKEDRQTLTLKGPDGATIAENAAAPLDRDKAQWMMYAGKKRTAQDWVRGLYAAEYKVLRRGEIVFVKRFELRLR